MEALIFSCIALLLHYNRKLVLFLLCLLCFYLSTTLIIVLYPLYPFQNIVILSLLQLVFIFIIYCIDSELDMSIVLFVFTIFTIVVGIGYFYLPFIDGIDWVLHLDSRICSELAVWANFTLFKNCYKQQIKQNVLFISWVLIVYGEDLWQYLN